MNKVCLPHNCIQLRVFFEDPFWIGIVEKEENGSLRVARIVFGAEPKDYEIEEYLIHNYYRLRFSPEVFEEQSDQKKMNHRMNPKRVQRQIKKQLKSAGIGTKSQQALSLEREACKVERKVRRKKRLEEEKERLYELKQKKRKEKHRGR